MTELKREETTLQYTRMKHKKHTKNPPLRKVLNRLSIGIMLATILLILPICIWLLKESLSSAIQESMNKEAQQYANSIDTWILQEKAMIQLLAEELEAFSVLDINTAKGFLLEKAALPSLEKAINIYIGLENNAFFEVKNAPLPPNFACTERPWYKQAMAADGVMVTTPYIDTLYEEAVVAVATKIYKDGKAIGVLAADVRVDFLVDTVEHSEDENGSYFFVIDNNNNILFHKDDALAPMNGTPINLASQTNSDYYKLVELIRTQTDVIKSQSITDIDGVEKFMRAKPLATTDWQVVMLAPTDILWVYVNALIVALVVLVAISSLVSIFIIRKISKYYFSPFEEVTKRLTTLSQGDIYSEIETKSNSKEVAEIYAAMQTTQDCLRRYISEISSVLDNIANNNLQVSLQHDYVGDFSSIKTSLTEIISSLNSAFYGIQEATRQVASGSQQVADGAQVLSQGASEQASAIETLASNLSHISTQVVQNAKSAHTATNLAEKSAVAVDGGSHQMAEMVCAMEDISSTSTQIGKIIKTIDDIAFQTNILALNAAVEAARAGASGKGFAVVAQEVRSLATKSAEAAKSTATLIEQSLQAIGKGGVLAKKTEESLSSIVDLTGQINGLIIEIATATEEQSTAIQQIDDSMEQISGIVQTNASTAEQSAALGEELSAQSGTLEDLVLKFKIQKGL